jgi:hypothetical protein
VHLTGIGMAEAMRLDVDDHEALQAPMEEKKVDSKPSVINAQRPLPPNKG